MAYSNILKWRDARELMVTAATGGQSLCRTGRSPVRLAGPGRGGVDPPHHQGNGALADQRCECAGAGISSPNKDQSGTRPSFRVRRGIKARFFVGLFVPRLPAFSVRLSCVGKRPENGLLPSKGLLSIVG